MGNKAKDDELYQEMCRVVGKVVLEMRDLGQEPETHCHCRRTAHLAGERQNSAFGAHRGGHGESHSRPFRALTSVAGGSGYHEADHRPDGNVTVVGHHRFVVDGGQRIVKVQAAEGVEVRHLIKAEAAD